MDLIRSAQQKQNIKRQSVTISLFQRVNMRSLKKKKLKKPFLFSLGTIKAPQGCPERRALPAVHLLSSSDARTITQAGHAAPRLQNGN